MLIWSVVIGGMLMLCLLLYPELGKEAKAMEEVVKNMGGFTAAFGMDRLSYGDLMGFYGIYGGCMLGIGGIFFSAVLGTGMLAKEEKEHTAEFLLTHPAGRGKVFAEKFAAMLAQMLMLNLFVILFSIVSFGIIGEKPDWETFLLFHAAQVLMQLEILCICYGVSAFLKRGSVSVGIGAAALLYFLGVFGNITEKAEAVRYITPYAYADAADIIPDAALDGKLIALGMAYAVMGIGIGYRHYIRKDIG